MTLVLAAVLALMGVCLIGLVWQNSILQEQLRDSEDMVHAKCVAHIASVVSNKIVAEAFRTAAVKYDSVENQHQMYRLTQHWSPTSNVSVPALWLSAEADRIEASNVLPLDVTV